MNKYHNVEQKKSDLKEYIPYTFIYIKSKSRVEVRIVIILGWGVDSDRKRALGLPGVLTTSISCLEC